MFEITKPIDIEIKSFEIITQELGEKKFPQDIEDIVKRVIHTSADFDYADNLYFSKGVVEKAIKVLKMGAHIVTDTNMAKAGINKKALLELGGQVHCFISDEAVEQESKNRQVTRAVVSVERASKLGVPVIYVVGNAPTALIQLNHMIKTKAWSPELIIGVPVGFVNVVESKELIIKSGIPCIVSRGRKGGSNIAAAICNAILYKIKQRPGF